MFPPDFNQLDFGANSIFVCNAIRWAVHSSCGIRHPIISAEGLDLFDITFVQFFEGSVGAVLAHLGPHGLQNSLLECRRLSKIRHLTPASSAGIFLDLSSCPFSSASGLRGVAIELGSIRWTLEELRTPHASSAGDFSQTVCTSALFFLARVQQAQALKQGSKFRSQSEAVSSKISSVPT